MIQTPKHASVRPALPQMRDDHANALNKDVSFCNQKTDSQLYLYAYGCF